MIISLNNSAAFYLVALLPLILIPAVIWQHYKDMQENVFLVCTDRRKDNLVREQFIRTVWAPKFFWTPYCLTVSTKRTESPYGERQGTSSIRPE